RLINTDTELLRGDITALRLQRLVRRIVHNAWAAY
ncbi:MAG: hypothetical protein ACI9ND_001063, partial [Yoonia sp.]